MHCINSYQNIMQNGDAPTILAKQHGTCIYKLLYDKYGLDFVCSDTGKSDDNGQLCSIL